MRRDPLRSLPRRNCTALLPCWPLAPAGARRTLWVSACAFEWLLTLVWLAAAFLSFSTCLHTYPLLGPSCGSRIDIGLSVLIFAIILWGKFYYHPPLLIRKLRLRLFPHVLHSASGRAGIQAKISWFQGVKLFGCWQRSLFSFPFIEVRKTIELLLRTWENFFLVLGMVW